MIISVSRRTDIPAFFSEWFMRRIRAGYCHVPNPFNAKQIAEVSLLPEDVDVFVFWSKNPAPLLPFLPELDERGYRYLFLYTLNDYPAELEPGVPHLSERLVAFQRLAEHVGPQRVIWRYDPIILSNVTDCRFHEAVFSSLAGALGGLTKRVIVSIADFYRKTDRRLTALQPQGLAFDKTPLQQPEFVQLLRQLKQIAESHHMHMQSCADELAVAGIPAGACIDGELLNSLWGIAGLAEDRHQRSTCRCVVSKDIGINDTCLHGCSYCYATRSHRAALANVTRHESDSSVLIGPSLPRQHPPQQQLPLL